ncbi:winged helix-turn-helix domain-containing protein [Stakelama tenebrarum]|uniref:Winged helix-turn-helix transcriptional regulator n=1 Tax=Stakelama tenebrarum TaxID=2711215 RepID=A0A6G6Y878_9SPHN|nr:winged helix-turn-helix domain-containing protein [Sphingosinithalassobacter tenebrarum]QIG81051.1 winged helix-turn-helix transcriptional regulator [Sphingosinithalassobacter tenebrarum]
MQQEAIPFAAVQAAWTLPRPGDAVRARILVAARWLLRRSEGSRLDLREVTTLSGVPLAIIRTHYPDSAALYRASRLALIEQVVARLPATPSASGEFDLLVSRYLRAACDALAQTAHRELAQSVRRDGEREPWLIAAYSDSITRPLAIGLEHLLLIGIFRGLVSVTDPARRADDLLARLLEKAGRRGGDPLQQLRMLVEAFYGSGADASRECGVSGASPATDERRPVIRRGALTLDRDPLEIRWQGRAIALSPIEARIVAELVERGRATSAQIQALIAAEGGRTSTRDVFLYRIRRKFAQAGAPDLIETVKGWGLKLRPQEAARSSVISEGVQVVAAS